MCQVHVLQDGYSYLKDGVMFANASCTLVISPNFKIIIDTLTPWDKDVILQKLRELKICPKQIDYVVSTHGHSDHTGNNNLFLEAKYHIVGYCISNRDQYYLHPFESGEPFIIDDHVKIVPTPGHTNEDISVVVIADDGKTIVIAGDLFEREEDFKDPELWTSSSFDKKNQAVNRVEILKIANEIIPGHGPRFSVTSPERSCEVIQRGHLKSAQDYLLKHFP